MIQVFENAEQLSQAAANLFAKQAQDALIKGRFSVALSGGSTPQRTYDLLSSSPLMDQIPWQIIHFFWGDERWVPPSSPHSNEGMVWQSLLNRVPVPEDQIHPMYEFQKSLEEAADDYNLMLKHFFQGEPHTFDWVFLGLGENGHTASLFPQESTLSPGNRWAMPTDKTNEGYSRITLTPDAINRSALIVFLVTGHQKAEIVQQVFEGPKQPEQYPAQLIQPDSGELLWMLEQAATQRLSEATLRQTQATRSLRQ